MGREVRRVPANWEHPKDENTGHHKPLHDGAGFRAEQMEWDRDWALWQKGEHHAQTRDEPTVCEHFEEWTGERPSPRDHMPEWPDEECTHFQMYEDTSEGTPISPVTETPEDLARWLADNGASSFAGDTATYEQWLPICRGGYAPSAVLDSKGLRSGVVAFAEEEDSDAS